MLLLVSFAIGPVRMFSNFPVLRLWINSKAFQIRKISFHWSIQNIMFFCIEVGFILYVCCYVKLIQQQIVSLLLLFGLSFILIYVERAITVKHLLTKVKAVSFKLWCYSNLHGSIGLITSMKQLRSFQCSF